MAILSVHRLPNSCPDEGLLKEYVARMRPLRLKSLQTDPSCFISKYESESAQPPKFWLDRLKAANAHHLVMIRSESAPADGDLDTLLQEEWVAFVVLLKVAEMSPESVKREEFDSSNKAGSWYMAALWLDPSIRGRGAGKQLVQAAIETMKEQSKKMETASASCITNAMHGNDTAIALYKKLGFKVTNEDAIEHKEGREYHTTELRLQL